MPHVRDRFALRHAGCLAFVLVGWAPSAAARGVAGEPSPQPQAELVTGWIADLSSGEYARREAATKGLSEAGSVVIDPLVEAINRGGDLEVTTRGIEILQGLLVGDDQEASAEAERVLEILGGADDPATSRLAMATLDFHNVALAEESQARLESLGATVETTMVPDGRVGFRVTLNEQWSGGSNDVKLVGRLPRVLQLSVHGVRLDEAAISQLSRLRRVEQIELYGTSLPDEAIRRIAEALPGTRVDYRRGGKLGVGGQPAVVPCIITQVQQGSAADRAGIQTGDVIRSFEGQAVESFEDLTAKIGVRGPGDRVRLTVERNGAPLPEKTLELDGWK